MAITNEEVKIKLGVDGSQVGPALAGQSAVFNKFITGMKSQLMSLARTNVYLMAVTVIKELLPTAQEFWDSVYGVDEAGSERIRKSNENLRKLRQEVMTTKAALNKAFEERSLRDADNLGKEAIFEGKMADNQSEKARAEARVKLLKDTKQPIEQIVAAQQEVRNLTLEQLEIEKKLSEVRAKFSGEEMLTSIKRRANITKEITDLRSDIKTYNELGFPDQAKAAENKINKLVSGRNNLEGLPPGVSANQYLLSMNPLWQKLGTAGMSKPITAEEFRSIMAEAQLNVIIDGVKE